MLPINNCGIMDPDSRIGARNPGTNASAPSDGTATPASNGALALSIC
jgi:hypothetical protein